MSEIRRCKECGKVLVGNKRTQICSACRRSIAKQVLAISALVVSVGGAAAAIGASIKKR